MMMGGKNQGRIQDLKLGGGELIQSSKISATDKQKTKITILIFGEVADLTTGGFREGPYVPPKPVSVL